MVNFILRIRCIKVNIFYNDVKCCVYNIEKCNSLILINFCLFVIYMVDMVDFNRNYDNVFKIITS